MKRLPIGTSDFKEVIEKNYYYVDKTLFIKELVNAVGQVVLIPRPRRFGKTLNLSMLRYFFEKSPHDNRSLFTNTTIWHEPDYMALQGHYPVIFLTFKDIKEDTWESAYKKLRTIIAKEFQRHLPIVQESMTTFELAEFIEIANRTADEEDYSTSFLLLSKVLFTHYNKKAVVLIDEYDAPIHEGYAHGYYPQVVKFFRSFFTSVFKDNSNLERGILTGILQTAKEGIFSGLNNLKTYSITHTVFQDKFGFTQGEVKKLLKDQKLSDKLPDVQLWYNGYLCGNTTIYNPWSLLDCAAGLLKPYWVNTSDNLLIKRILAAANEDIKSDLELLLSGKTIKKEIDEAVIFPGIENNPKALWSLLLFSGYLTYTTVEIIQGATICTLIIPNKEINLLYVKLIKDIFEESLTGSKALTLLTAITTGDASSIEQLL